MPQTIQHRKKIDQSTHEKKEFVFRAKVKEKNQRLIDVPEIVNDVPLVEIIFLDVFLTCKFSKKFHLMLHYFLSQKT